MRVTHSYRSIFLKAAYSENVCKKDGEQARVRRQRRLIISRCSPAGTTAVKTYAPTPPVTRTSTPAHIFLCLVFNSWEFHFKRSIIL